MRIVERDKRMKSAQIADGDKEYKRCGMFPSSVSASLHTMRTLLISACLFLISAAQLDLFKGLLGSGTSTAGENNPFSSLMSGILNPDNESRRNRYRSRYSNEDDYDESDRDLLRRHRNRNRDRTDIFGNRRVSDRDRYDRDREEYGDTNSNPLGSLLGSGTGNTDNNNPFNLGGLLGKK